MIELVRRAGIYAAFSINFRFVDSPWRLASVGAVASAVVIELHLFGHQLRDFSNSFIAPQPQLLVFYASPKTLDKHVIHPATFPVHAHFNTVPEVSPESFK